MQAPKNGYFYVLDRATGELLSATPFVPMTWSTGFDHKTGRPIEHPDARFYKTGKPFLLSPSGLGAHSWQPMSFSPLTGLVYIPVQQLPVIYKDEQGQVAGPQKFNINVDFGLTTPPKDMPIGGWLAAWDPVANKEVWRAPHPGPVNGGTMVTAGNLVFQGDAQGNFSAYAANDGRKLWSFDAQAGMVAAPISYAVKGQQYIAIMAGWGGNLPLLGGARVGVPGPNRLLIFKLDGTAKLPPSHLSSLRGRICPKSRQARHNLRRGDDYRIYCSRCHGMSVISGGITPDLRHSGALEETSWLSIVKDGALADNGRHGCVWPGSRSRNASSAFEPMSLPRHGSSRQRPNSGRRGQDAASAGRSGSRACSADRFSKPGNAVHVCPPFRSERHKALNGYHASNT